MECQPGITALQAEIDYQTEGKYRNGDFNCFCLDKYENDQPLDFKFPLDGETHCEEWYIDYWTLIFVPQFIAGVMGTINIVIDIAVRVGTHFVKKPLSET